MKRYSYGNERYVVAQDPMMPGGEPEAPTEEELVQDIEEDPGTEWQERYLQPIIRAIRSRFDLERGQVMLVAPRKETPFGTDAYSFRITGHVRFEDFSPDTSEFGEPPYRFLARVKPDGQLSKRIEVYGHEID